MGDLLIVIGHALHAAACQGTDGERQGTYHFLRWELSAHRGGRTETRTTRRERGREGGREGVYHFPIEEMWESFGNAEDADTYSFLPPTHSQRSQTDGVRPQFQSTPTTKDRDGTSLRVVWRGVLVQWG